METPTTTLPDLADFLLALPDDAPINMYDGDADALNHGCLMTQYGRSKGWKFDHSYSTTGTWETPNEHVVARVIDETGKQIHSVLPSLFNRESRAEFMPRRYNAKPWKDLLKDEFKNK